MVTRRIRSKDSLVSILRDTTSRNAATEVYATPIPVQPGEITGNQLAWQAVNSDSLAVQAVSSQKFAVGAWVPTGENIQRVPAPMRDYNYWIDVIDGNIKLHQEGLHGTESMINVSADLTGVTMTPTASDPARLYLTGRLRRPKSSKLLTDVTGTDRVATLSSVTTSGSYMRLNTAAAHTVVAGDTITVTNSTRTISLTGGFTGNTGNPVITVTVPTGHGIAQSERLVLTTTGTIASSLPSGTYVPSVVSATQLSITGTAPSTSGGISGTMTIALASGWVDGTYTVRAVGSQTIDVDKLTSRYHSSLSIGTNAAFTDAGTVTAGGLPYGTTRVVWWATDELATNYRYIYPSNKQLTTLASTVYEASSVVVTVGGGTGGATNKATLTLSATHDMQVGEQVNVTGTSGVSGVTGPLDGQYVITEITTTSPYSVSYDTAESTPTTARSLVIGGANVGRASLEVYDYAVYVELAANSAASLVSQASVFEVIGSTSSATGSTTEVSPLGLSVGTGTVAKAAAIASDVDTTLVVKQYSADTKTYVENAAIYADGTVSAILLKGDEVNIDGVNVVDNFATVTRNGAAYSDALSLLNRLPRGIVYHGRWTQPASLTLSAGTGAQEYVIAHGSFTPEDGRAYRVELTTGGLRVEAPSRAVFVDLRFSTTAFTAGNYGTSYHLSSFAGGSASSTDWSVIDGLCGVFHATSAVSVVTDNYRLPAAQVYWAFIMRTSGTIAAGGITVSSSASAAGTAATALIVEDIGPSLLNSSNTLSTSATYVGALTSAGGPGTTAYTATKTITATETGYFDNYGRGTGSDTYTNQYSLYQGNPGTAGGTKKSAIEFPALGLPSGATITGLRLYLKNTSTYDGSCQVHVAPHGTAELSTSLPAAITSSAVTSRTYSSGEAAWITLPSSLYAGFAAGTSKGILVGITSTASTNVYDSTLSNYGYFQGVGTGMTYPPKLEITYTYTA